MSDKGRCLLDFDLTICCVTVELADFLLERIPEIRMIEIGFNLDLSHLIYITESLIGFMLLLEYPTAGRIRL